MRAFWPLVALTASIGSAPTALAQPAAPSAAPSSPAAPVGTFPAEPGAAPSEASAPAPSAPAEPPPPPAASAEPPPPAGPPPPLASTAAPEPAPREPSDSEPTEPASDTEKRDARSFYVLAALLGGVHVHASRYEVAEGLNAEMGEVGLSYELLLMLGSKRKNFALGGAASFVHAPKTSVRFEGELYDELYAEYEADARPGILAGTVGAGVDYHSRGAFHIGGLIGLALENVPEFAPEPREKEWLAGLGMGLWIGGDWKIDDNTSLGILATGHLRRCVNRDEGVSNPDNVEASLSLGLGASVAYH